MYENRSVRGDSEVLVSDLRSWNKYSVTGKICWLVGNRPIQGKS